MSNGLRRMMTVGLLCGAAVLSVEARPVTGLQSAVTLPVLLERLGKYVDQYEADLAAVVSEEEYQQEVTPQGSRLLQKRTLRSDFLLAKAGDAGWVAFRDVAEVDGKPIRDRSDRLMELFLKPSGDSADQVRKIVESSSRLNLGWVSRNFNVPTMVLQVAKTTEQHRSEFKLGGVSDIAGMRAREIRFEERTLPRMIQTRDGAAASGRFWIEESSGRVLKTELQVNSRAMTAVIAVTYAHQPKLRLWLPVLMTERYSGTGVPIVTGRAVYGNFRRFNVAVEAIIK